MIKKIYQIIRSFLAIIGLIVCTIIVFVISQIQPYFSPQNSPVSSNNLVLTLDLKGKLLEKPKNSLFAIDGKNTSLLDLLKIIEQAQYDSRIKALVLKFHDPEIGFAQAEELNKALLAFKSSKPIYTYTDTFGELSPANISYFLASSSKQIWIQSGGFVGLTGIAIQTPFIKKALKKVGIENHYLKRSEYKSAFDSTTEEKMNPLVKNMTTTLLNDLSNTLVKTIADNRKLEQTTVLAAINNAPLTDQEALETKLIDSIGTLDEMHQAIRKQILANSAEFPLFIDSADYQLKFAKSSDKKPSIAIIYATGAIIRGDAEESLLSENNITASENIVKACDQAIDDSKVKAIILKIDSPGGSAIASETIRQALLKAKRAGKPIVA